MTRSGSILSTRCEVASELYQPEFRIGVSRLVLVSSVLDCNAIDQSGDISVTTGMNKYRRKVLSFVSECSGKLLHVNDDSRTEAF